MGEMVLGRLGVGNILRRYTLLLLSLFDETVNEHDFEISDDNHHARLAYSKIFS